MRLWVFKVTYNFAFVLCVYDNGYRIAAQNEEEMKRISYCGTVSS
jgi:hypothetical protein